MAHESDLRQTASPKSNSGARARSTARVAVERLLPSQLWHSAEEHLKPSDQGCRSRVRGYGVTLPDAKKSDAGVEPRPKPNRKLIEECADQHDVAIGYFVGDREKVVGAAESGWDISHPGGNRHSCPIGAAKRGTPGVRIYGRRALDFF